MLLRLLHKLNSFYRNFGRDWKPRKFHLGNSIHRKSYREGKQNCRMCNLSIDWSKLSKYSHKRHIHINQRRDWKKYHLGKYLSISSMRSQRICWHSFGCLCRIDTECYQYMSCREIHRLHKAGWLCSRKTHQDRHSNSFHLLGRQMKR